MASRTLSAPRRAALHGLPDKRPVGRETARVQTSRYVRENIRVSLLAKPHVAFLDTSSPPGAVRRLNLSGYAESQGAFAERVSSETANRLGRPCRLEFGTQN